MNSGQVAKRHGLPFIEKTDMDEMVKVLLECNDWSGLINYSETPIYYIANHIFGLDIQEQPLDSHMDALGFVVYADVPYLTEGNKTFLTRLKKETLVVNSYLLTTHRNLQRNAVVARLLAHWLLHYDFIIDQAQLGNNIPIHVVKAFTKYPSREARALAYQASAFAAALMMPATTVETIANNAFAKYHVQKGLDYNTRNRKLYKALKSIAKHYGVSMQTARIRMRDLKYIA